MLIGSADDNFVPTVEEKPADRIGEIGDRKTYAVTTEQLVTDAVTTNEMTWATHDEFVEIYEEDTSSNNSIIIIVASGVIAVCAIIIIQLLRKK